MSLINKMLQDLDARRAHDAGSAEAVLKPAQMSLPRRRAPLIAAGVAVAVVLAAGGGWFGWQRWKARTPALAARVAAPTQLAQGQNTNAHLPPAGELPRVPEAAVVHEASSQKASARAKPDGASGTQPGPARPVPATASEHLAKGAATGGSTPSAALNGAATSASAPKPGPEHAVARKPGAAASAAHPAGSAQTAAVPAKSGREMTAQQTAESEYARALAALQEARINEAIGALEQALTADPRHDAARQTLVRLLLEARRPAEAIRVLQTGLSLDPRQPNMAMLLARLQIEAGGTGIDTLQRSLPYAAGNGEYHAFLAGALARAQRQREAIEQYQAALRAVPGNGVWWMGLGLSLQAEQRNAEAADAFGRALAAGNLSPQLQEFVTRRLDQLKR